METVKKSLDEVAAAMQKLESENERLRLQVGEHSSQVWKAKNVEDQLRPLNERIAKLERELKDKTAEAYYWRRATRYEQMLKKPPKTVRHIPNYNDLRRAARRDNHPEWLGYRANPERIFLKHWRAENKRKSGINGGRGILEILMSDDPNCVAADVSQRDATVAATVIQWLGTNCGRCFLEECEKDIQRRIDAERKSRKAG